MYIAIVNTENNRVIKFNAFNDQEDANGHASEYGGFVYNNTNNDPIPDLWIEGQTVTVVPLVIPKSYECTNWQMIQALDESNMLSSVEAYINHDDTPLLVKKGYLHAGTFKLTDSWMQTAITALGLSEAQAIGLFELAMSK